MALTRTKDPVDVAVAKSAAATNLFAQAQAQLEDANGILQASIEADREAATALEKRIAFAQEQVTSNAKVATKLGEFTA